LFQCSYNSHGDYGTNPNLYLVKFV
jgi:hypothetical protein